MPGLTQQVKSCSYNILNTTADLALFLLAFGAKLSVSGMNSKAVSESANWAQGITAESLVRAVRTGREKGWIKRDLTVTWTGEKRLSSLLPQPRKYPRRWNSTWYIISFDIPRKLDYKRNRLRETLRRLGFGKLHDSLWISPQDFLGDVLDFAKIAKVGQYLMPAISKELGNIRSTDLAERVWHLKELETRYINWINALGRELRSAPELFLEYISILKDDPFLPKPLLNEGWYGTKAHALAKKHFPNMLKELRVEGERLKEEYTEKDPRKVLAVS